MKVVVVGGSAAGLLTALVLAEAGHEVEVLDRDPLEPAPDVESAAATAFRASAPQIVQAHALLPLCRELLLEHLPSVYEDLLDTGAVEAPLSTQMPPSLLDRDPRPGDERLTMLFTRRSTFDWVLLRSAVAAPAVTLRGRTRVRGFTAIEGLPPNVTGVMTDDGDVAADLVVDASGRRSQIDTWLEAIGAQSTEMAHAECGLAYYGRHYRRSATAAPGPRTTRMVAGLDEFTVGLWSADNDAAVMTIAPLVEDKRFRAVTDPKTFEAVLCSVPALSPWVAAMTPTSDVFPMGGLHNSMRHLVVDGSPVHHWASRRGRQRVHDQSNPWARSQSVDARSVRPCRCSVGLPRRLAGSRPSTRSPGQRAHRAVLHRPSSQ